MLTASLCISSDDNILELHSFPTRRSSDLATFVAPRALRTPISRVLSVTDTSMMFMMPMPPTRRLTAAIRSEEHTSELQSQSNLVCLLPLEKKHNASSHIIDHCC